MRFVVIIFFGLLFVPGSIFSQASWVHTNGPSGVCSPYLLSNEEYAFIQEADFLFRTTDGIQWEKIEHAGVYKFAIYKDTLVQPLYNSTEQALRLQISTDNGVNWVATDDPAYFNGYGDIAMNSQGIFLVQPRYLTHSTLYRTINFGETWDSISTPIQAGNYPLEIFDDRIYVTSYDSLFRLDTDGHHWEKILLPFSFIDPWDTYDFVVKDSNILVATKNRVYFSHDDGKIWFQLDVQSGYANNKLTLVGNDVYFLYENVFQYGNFLLKSSDFGNTWDTLSTNVGMGSDIFTGGSGVFLASDGVGVFRWDESSQHLIESNNGLSKGCVSDISYGEDLIWAVCGGGLFAYDVPSKTWRDRINLQPIGYTYVSTNENGWVMASAADILYLSIDKGLTWDTIHTEYQIDRLQLLGSNIFITDDDRVFRSTDKGLSWNYINLYLKNGDFAPFLDKQYVAGYNRVYHTSDDGLTFQGSNIPIDIQQLTSFENVLFGLTSDSFGRIDLYISEDAVNWIYAGEGLPNLGADDFVSNFKYFFFRDADHYYAFFGGPIDFLLFERMYWSPVDEISWSLFPFSSPNTGIDWLIHDNILYMGGQGMYTSEIQNPFITGTKEISIISTNLFSIAPNPAKEFITLQFENGITKKGIIQIYSITGVPLKTMDLDNLDSEINISTVDLTEGVYYVQWKGEKYVDVKTFVKTN